MKKIIPTILTLAFTISVVSLSVGCSGKIPEDPNAVKNEKENQKEPDGLPKDGSGVKGIGDNSADGGFNEDGTEKNPPKKD